MLACIWAFFISCLNESKEPVGPAVSVRYSNDLEEWLEFNYIAVDTLHLTFDGNDNTGDFSYCYGSGPNALAWYTNSNAEYLTMGLNNWDQDPDGNVWNGWPRPVSYNEDLVGSYDKTNGDILAIQFRARCSNDKKIYLPIDVTLTLQINREKAGVSDSCDDKVSYRIRSKLPYNYWTNVIILIKRFNYNCAIEDEYLLSGVSSFIFDVHYDHFNQSIKNFMFFLDDFKVTVFKPKPSH